MGRVSLGMRLLLALAARRQLILPLLLFGKRPIADATAGVFSRSFRLFLIRRLIRHVCVALGLVFGHEALRSRNRKVRAFMRR